MDAPEDDLDIKLRKVSSDLIEDFDRSLQPFLRKPDNGTGSRVRSRVRSRETTRLISNLLEPFQELPQLLDPHLPKWVPLLAETFLEYLQTRRRSKPLSNRSELLMPLPAAICKIIYTLCKIRGEKIIVRFLNVETKYLELLLSAVEVPEKTESSNTSTTLQWTWEERYVVLLWLSHLLLAPFDLSTISSGDLDEVEASPVPGFRWPPNVPSIAFRVLPLAIKYLSSPGKERDAAKFLLVRISMRKDMQEIGILHALIQWALFSLRPQKDQVLQSPYHYIGILSYLSGILVSSSDTSDMDKYLSDIFYAVQKVMGAEEQPLSEIIASSALARKLAIKVMRSIVVLVLRKEEQDMTSTEMVEGTIGHLLESLADNDTPVRFAASKALSVITLKLDTEMAAQVVEAVLDSLNRNVLWVKSPSNPSALPTRDLTSVDPLEWHGLMLTLSHLIYRRSPPVDNLRDIIRALLLGLSFERRSPSGGSIGTNVRDAACFGIWALARRYSTTELLAVSMENVPNTGSSDTQTSVLQILATELIVTASLDPAGNIRRGASAALQELIGRHPDTVEKGIWVVQTVDYHAVALRSRAILEVAVNATKLASRYGEAMLEALLGWRGIGDSDAAARRVAGASFGAVTAELARQESSDSLKVLMASVRSVLEHIKELQLRQVDERHGLLLSFAAVLDHLPGLLFPSMPENRAVVGLINHIIDGLNGNLRVCKKTTFRRPELITEAASRLVVSSFPALQAALQCVNAEESDHFHGRLLSGSTLIEDTNLWSFHSIVSSLDDVETRPEGLETTIQLLEDNLDGWLNRPEPESTDAASKAAVILLLFADIENRQKIVEQWAAIVQYRPTSRVGTGSGYFFALTMAYPVVASSGRWARTGNELICSSIQERWAHDNTIETRVAILQGLTQGDILRYNTDNFLDVITEGLDDYTINARGDVGSHVRSQALKATKRLWNSLGQGAFEGNTEPHTKLVSGLLHRVLRLAAEKLDRVRIEAQATLALTLQSSYSEKFLQSTFSSRGYFHFLLSLLTKDWLHPNISSAAKSDPEGWMDELMAGFVTSADTGNEDLVIASRAALSEYCEESQENLDRVCAALVRNLKNRQGQDRVVVPTLEIIAFMFYVGAFRRCTEIDYKNLCLLVQKSGYKTGNVRKLEACIKVYGGITGIAIHSDRTPLRMATLEERRAQGITEARKRLGALMMHPWPRVRSLVIDELWGLVSAEDGDAAERLKGVDWGKAEKGPIKALVEELTPPSATA